MKKTLLTLMCFAAMMAAGMGLRAQEVTITLTPYWNWISYPHAVPMELNEALVGLEPAEGDIIKSHSAFVVFQNGRWSGVLTHFMPGKGYMYYSARSETVSFVFAQPSSSVVATATPTDITATSAVAGGMVMLPEGSHVFLRGVCWGTTPSPNIDGNHTTNGTGIGTFTTTLDGLNPNTTYYVRAYAVSDYGLAYGNQQSFTTVVEYQYVDLGLPSGLLWATCNLGADAPENYGDYFAWGETQPKDNFSWTNYQYCMGSFNTLTKYCNNPDIGYNGFTDDLTTLLPEDDAATANWGDDWRMPTEGEWQELYQNTTVTWITQNGVNGRLFTASNGNSLFLPSAGYCNESVPEAAGIIGDYWTSSLDTDYPSGAFSFFFNSNNYYISFCNRLYGRTVRAVHSGSQNTSFNIEVTANPAEGGMVSGGGSYLEGDECTLTATANEGYIFANWTENGEVVSTDVTYTFTVDASRTMVANFALDHAYVDLGLPSGLLWATCNVGADNPENYGDYFAWGETTTKDTYNSSTYSYFYGGFYDNSGIFRPYITKYCTDYEYGYYGLWTDYLTTLLPENDAATANWGSDWRMPTSSEWHELYNNTTVTWTTQNGVNGRLFTAPNGNSIFLPAAGLFGESLNYNGEYGYYWSSSLTTDFPIHARSFYFDSGNYRMSSRSRSFGHSVRAVRSSGQN